MAKNDEVSILDMGKSVKVIDLVPTMFQLSGLSVRDKTDPDIEIEEAGLRAGEELSPGLSICYGSSHFNLLYFGWPIDLTSDGAVKVNEMWVGYIMHFGAAKWMKDGTLPTIRSPRLGIFVGE